MKKSIILAILAASVSGLAFAGSQTQSQSEEAKQQAAQQMQQLDTNKDNKLSKEEAQANPELVAAWDVVDVNKDGSVDETEYALFAEQKQLKSSGEGSSSGSSTTQQQTQ